MAANDRGRRCAAPVVGYTGVMTDENQITENTDPSLDERLQAIQAVVDRVSSWQDGATEDTVEQELRDGFGEAGVDVSGDEVERLAAAIQERHGAVSAQEVLSA